ncbi:MAG: hypothetical protein IT276_08835 [Ignavibacteriaceae bacterium]|nr:hypothetical protein [Ignavibacterium sp.]MCC6255006.1 hypothetical protein [Ignavibacteriaceae bacterium]HRP92036.1 hypothetical protein [Ignavibacteriaceae bacterium]
MTSLEKKSFMKKQEISSKKLEVAKEDYDELMKQIKPFIKKSDIILASTDGKWYDTTGTLENVIVQNSLYQ